MDNKELQNRRKETTDHTEEETTWGGPAGDILTGIRNTENAPAERAIWELVQNARDVSWEDVPAVISFVRRTDGLEFTHYGKPFSDVSLGSLIKQTSSKVRNDIKTVGKYGTGFLTTHRFGRMIKLSGLLQVVDGEDLYYPFSLPIDRTSDDKDVLKKKLQEQYNEVKGWGYDSSLLTTVPHGKTSFMYESRSVIEKEALKTAFDKAPELTPFVLVLNQKYVKEISFKDEVVDKEVVFALSAVVDKPIKEGDSYYLRRTDVSIKKNGQSNTVKQVYYLVSKTTDERIDEGVVTVILPIKDIDGRLFEAFDYSSEITNLYLSLPLIGTEDWGINYLLHSPLFECENDSRNGLRIIPPGLGLDDNENPRMLETVFVMINDWMADSLGEIENRKFLAKVNFKNTSKIPAVAGYFDNLQQKWSGLFKDLELALNDKSIYIKPSELYVVDNALFSKACIDEAFMNAVYEVLRSSYPGHVSCKDDFLDWCKCVNDWRRPEGEMHIHGIEDLIESISALKLDEGDGGLSKDWMVRLRHIVKYLIESGNERLLGKAIIPNEKGFLRPIEKLCVPKGFSADFRRILDDIVPTAKDGFIQPSFYALGISGLPDYTEKEAKEAISSRIGELQRQVDGKLKAIKVAVIENRFDKKDSQWYEVINDSVLNSVLALFTMWIDRTADNKEAKLHRLFSDYLEVTEFTREKISKEYFTDCEQMWRTLLFEVAYRFELLSEEEQEQRKEWLKRLVSVLKNYDTFSEYLDKFMFFPDQIGRLRFSSSLVNGVDIDDDLKGYYDEIVSSDGETIKTRLVDDEFAPFMPPVEIWDNAKVAGLIEDVVSKVDGYPDISGYSKKASVLQIVKRFNSDSDTGKQWISWFKLLSAQKTTILVSFAESDSVFKLLLQPEGRLNRMSELASSKDCDAILKRAEQLLEQQRFDDADMQYKRELGLYVEDYLVEQLKNLLRDNDTFKAMPEDGNLEDKDVQGGQDIIVYLLSGDNQVPLYFIEVKSRWSTKDSVEMSKLQMEKSVREKERYSLCVVDMHDYDKEKVFRKEYPKSLEEIKERIAVVPNIGYQNKDLVTYTADSVDEVHIGGDVKSIVPQVFVRDNHCSLDEMLAIIKGKVEAYYENRCR